MKITLENIRDNGKVNLTTVRELFSEYKISLVGIKNDLAIGIKIWERADGRFEYTVSHIFKPSTAPSFRTPDAHPQIDPERALNNAIEEGLLAYDPDNNNIDTRKNTNF